MLCLNTHKNYLEKPKQLTIWNGGSTSTGP